MLHPNHHEKVSHHDSHDHVVYEWVDQYGQIHAERGRGFRTANIYEQIDRSEITKVFIEAYDPSVKAWLCVWEHRSKKIPCSLDDVLRLRDAGWPKARVVEYVGSKDGDGIRTIYPPK